MKGILQKYSVQFVSQSRVKKAMKKQFHKIKIAAENFSQRFVYIFQYFFSSAICWKFEGQIAMETSSVRNVFFFAKTFLVR